MIRSWGTTVDTLVTTFIAKPMAATAKHHVSINFLVAAPWSGEGACHAVLTMAVSICANVRISLADR